MNANDLGLANDGFKPIVKGQIKESKRHGVFAKMTSFSAFMASASPTLPDHEA